VFSLFPHEKRLFISYSHTDANLIHPLVAMLCAAKSAAVFLDRQSIPPGADWRASVAKGIYEADVMFLFWCNHSAASEEVRREYETAIKAAKKVIPSLLDSTPLPDVLHRLQWIDFRSTVAGSHPGPTGVTQNSGLQNPDVHKNMARAIVEFLTFGFTIPARSPVAPISLSLNRERR
jgi:hypothetical protein